MRQGQRAKLELRPIDYGRCMCLGDRETRSAANKKKAKKRELKGRKEVGREMIDKKEIAWI